MPRKHQLDRRRHRRDGGATASNQPSSPPTQHHHHDGPSFSHDPQESPRKDSHNEQVDDERDWDSPSTVQPDDDDEDPLELSDEEEADNPNDEDFEANESSSNDEDDDALNEEDYVPTNSRRSTRKTQGGESRASSRRTTTRRGRQQVFQEDSSSDEEEYNSPSQRRSQRRATSRRNYSEVDSDQEQEEYSDSPQQRSTPSRASARRANRKLHESLQYDEEEDEMKLPMLNSGKKKRKRQDDSDSEEYRAGNEDEEEGLSAEGENDSFVDETMRNVDNESFCSMDSSSDDEKVGPSPVLDIRRRRKVANDASDDDASLSEFQTNTPDDNSQAPRHRCQVTCPSTHDVITMDPLAKKHICYITPDKTTRHCFALETLHKIAMTTPHKEYDKDGKKMFLQPPHFRSAISDDLMDQIASKFGRAALDLDGYFYNREKEKIRDSQEEEYMVNFDGSVADTETFLFRLNEYISNYMGSQDIYCCPLCYTEAYRSLMQPDHSADDDSDHEEEEEDKDDGGGNFVFSQDPMTILGSLDDEKFQLASNFCFTKIAQVKRHLREDHHVDTSILDGNGLFPRFKIRESDGLLQRYIDTCHWMAYQGSMARYWNEGNNQMFIQLLHLMKRTQYLKNKMANDAERDAIGEYDQLLLDDADVYFRSFEKRAKRVWEKLSAPYRKMSNRELDDFIDTDENDEEVEQPTPIFHNVALDDGPKLSPDEQVIAELRKRRRESGGQIMSEDESQQDSEIDNASNGSKESNGELNDSDDSNQSDESDDGYYSEEQDEWVKKLRQRGQKVKRRNKKRKSSSPAVNYNRLGKKRKLSGSPSSIRPVSPLTGKKKQRRIVLSDDEE